VGTRVEKMALYEHYAGRERNFFGKKLKVSFARKAFRLSVEGLGDILSILELGPGDGYIAELSRTRKFHYLGIDGSSTVALKLMSQGFKIINACVPPLPPGLGKFDICFALHLFEHLKTMNEAGSLIKDIGEHLNPQGRLVLATPDYLRWGKDFFNCDYTHTLPFTLKRLSQLIVNSDFEIQHADIYVGNVFGLGGIPLYWMAKLAYFRTIDALLYNSLRSDSWYRAYLTFLPNLFVVANKIHCKPTGT
jgi:SAM-dependent methyltransferase